MPASKLKAHHARNKKNWTSGGICLQRSNSKQVEARIAKIARNMCMMQCDYLTTLMVIVIFAAVVVETAVVVLVDVIVVAVESSRRSLWL